MKRKKFIGVSGLALGGLIINPLQVKGQEEKEQYDPGVIDTFVRAGHNDLGKVKELLEEYPNIVNATWDWGNGDFETAAGGAGHVGNKEIAEFLITKGARINLFTLTMLGKTDLVTGFIEEYPALLFAKGPHGFTLLHHAKVGGNEVLTEYFQSRGLKQAKLKLG